MCAKAERCVLEDTGGRTAPLWRSVRGQQRLESWRSQVLRGLEVPASLDISQKDFKEMMKWILTCNTVVCLLCRNGLEKCESVGGCRTLQKIFAMSK